MSIYRTADSVPAVDLAAAQHRRIHPALTWLCWGGGPGPSRAECHLKIDEVRESEDFVSEMPVDMTDSADQR